MQSRTCKQGGLGGLRQQRATPSPAWRFGHIPLQYGPAVPCLLLHRTFFFFFCIYLCNYAVHVSRVIFKLVKNGCREGTNPPEQIQSERTRRCKPSQPAIQNRGPECLLLTRPKLSEKVLLLKLMFALILHTKPRHLAPAFEGNTVPQFTHRVPALCSEATH